jgi:hypothetical protein
VSFPSVSLFISPLVCLLSVLLPLIVSSHLSLSLLLSSLFSHLVYYMYLFSPTLSSTCVFFSQFSHYLFQLYFKTLYLSSIYLLSFLSTSLPVGLWLRVQVDCLTAFCKNPKSEFFHLFEVDGSTFSSILFYKGGGSLGPIRLIDYFLQNTNVQFFLTFCLFNT